MRGSVELRQQRRRNPALADIDHHDPDRKAHALCAQRIRAARIAAAELTNVHATAQLTDDQAADQRSKQIGEEGFERRVRAWGARIAG